MEDKFKLTELSLNIRLVKQFIKDGVTKKGIEEKIKEARSNLEKNDNDTQSIFYNDEGKMFPTTKSTGAYLELARLLNLKIEMHPFSDNLEETLNKLAREEVELLEKISLNPDVLNKSQNK